MAALPYMQFYVAEYLADTMHLSTEEHGAYLLLIFNYWQTGKPIPKNRLSRIAKIPNDRWTTVEDSLKEFFNDTGTEWVHKRIEADLAVVAEAHKQKAAAGKASAESRKRAKQAEEKQKASDRSTPVATPVATPVDIPLPVCSNETATNRTEQNRTEQIIKNTMSGNPPDASPSPVPVEKSKPKTTPPDDTPHRVIEYLNQKTGKKFQPADANLKFIKARIAEGATWETLTGVVDLKCAHWLNDPKMHEYLRPSTLFNAEKYNQYVGLIGAPRPRTREEELDEAFGLTSSTSDGDDCGGDIFDGVFQEVIGGRG